MKNILLFASLLLLCSCSHPVLLHKPQTTVSYAERLNGRVGLYVSSELKQSSLDVAATGDACSGHKYPMSFGQTLSDAVQAGVETACGEVVLLAQKPSAQEMQSQHLKMVLVPSLTNANGDISFSSAFFSSPTCKATFQGSVTMSLMDATGKTFYSFTSNGVGLNSGSATCPEGADILSKATGSALQQIADNVAQTLNGNAQIRDATK